MPGGTALSVRSAFVARCAACVYVGVYVGCRMIVRESEGREAKQGKEKRERRLRDVSGGEKGLETTTMPDAIKQKSLPKLSCTHTA